MTEQGPPMRRPIPAALVVARRAMVVAAAAMVIAALAVVVALLGEPGTDPAETAAVEQARDDASSAQEEADAATAMADAAIVIAEEAAAVAAAAQAALADAMAAAGETVDPATIARLEAQLEEARNLAATALVAADAAGGATGADDDAPEDGTEAGEELAEEPMQEEPLEDPPVSEEAPVEEPMPEDDAAATDEDAAEPDDTGAAADLPGEPLVLGPAEGAGLAVVGIRYDSALNMRAVPNGEIIARLDNVMDGVRDPAIYVRRPNSDDIITTVVWKRGVVATGNTRELTTSTWHEFLAGDLTGWSSAAFLAQLGATEDATSEVVDALGELPVADTMVELGLEVAQTMTSEEPQSSVVVSGAPGLAGDLGQVTIDIVGIGDDSVRGFRLVVFAHPAEDWTEDDPGPFTLKSVERTVLCHSHRGVSDEGLCL